jgi:hypothetical protein
MVGIGTAADPARQRSATASITTENAGLGDRAGIVLDRSPVRLVAPLRTERADGVDGLRRGPDMAHHRHAAFDQKGMVSAMRQPPSSLIAPQPVSSAPAPRT